MQIQAPRELRDIAQHYIRVVGMRKFLLGLMRFIAHFEERERQQGNWNVTLGDLVNGLLRRDLGYTVPQILGAIQHGLTIMREKRVKGYPLSVLMDVSREYRRRVVVAGKVKVGGCNTCGGKKKKSALKMPRVDSKELKDLVIMNDVMDILSDLGIRQSLMQVIMGRTKKDIHDVASKIVATMMPRLVNNKNSVCKKIVKLLKTIQRFVMRELEREKSQRVVATCSDQRKMMMDKSLARRLGIHIGGDVEGIGEELEGRNRRQGQQQYPPQPGQQPYPQQGPQQPGMPPQQGQYPQQPGMPPQQGQQPYPQQQPYYPQQQGPYPQNSKVSIEFEEKGYCANYRNAGQGAGGFGILLLACDACSDGV